MDRKIGKVIVWGKFVLVAVLSAAWQIQAQSAKAPYPHMAPIAQYLMARNAEIALARSAAPESISRNATVLVLGRHGWETAIQGTNGFVCMVERGLGSGIDFGEKWNPKIKGPDCLNPAAARTMVPIVYKETEMELAGDSVEQRVAGIQAEFEKKEIPSLAPGAMGYMMSKEAYLTDNGSHDISHLMIFLPNRKGSDWGAGVRNSPVFASVSYWFATDDGNLLNKTLPTLRVFVVAVPMWSDGSSAVNK